MGRNKAPSENTVRMLCSKSAGMCEFEGCNKRLFFDGVTLSKFNNAYVAHIIASSAKGPRGDKTLSPLLSDKLENLMILTAPINVQGLHKVSESLERCFGHNIVKRSLAEDGNDTKIARENKTLYVDGLTGGLKTAPSQTTKKVGGHTFFGN